MVQVSKTFRVFVSSTFSDLKEERNALQEKVFPRLRELCMQHGCRFQAIDLRWGISEEAGRDQQTMNICLQELERCQTVTPRPNFIVLLGDRYGWCPLPPQIKAKEFEEILTVVSTEDEEPLVWREQQPHDRKGWYRKDENAAPAEYCLRPRELNIPENAGDEEKKAALEKETDEWNELENKLRSILLNAVDQLGWPDSDSRRIKYEASATHQEILNGAMSVQDAHEHVYSFFRRIEGLPKNPMAGDFIDINEKGHVDKEAQKKLESLKKNLRHRLTGNIYEYKARWTGSGVTTDHIGKLCDDVYHALSRVILEQISELTKIDEVETEIKNHQSWGKERAKFFTGRASILKSINDFLKGNDIHPLAMFGLSGSGKTALMAYAAQKTQEAHHNAEVIVRFIGVTPSSTDGRSLLESLCHQISRYYGADESTIPVEYRHLVEEFPKRLALATERKPLILFLDALDQLSDADRARSLSWLPANLSKNVYLVVSCLPGGCLNILKRKLPTANLIELKPMLPGEGEELLNLWLKDAGRTLQHYQREDLLARFQQSGLPLYLKLAFEEARCWKSYTESVELSSDIPGIIRDLFRRLSLDANHGQMMVSRSLGYLVAAKNGLTEDELLDILSLDEDVLKDFSQRALHKPPQEMLPVVVWSRLYFDLKPYLTERSADGTTVITFYHPLFATTVAEEKFLLGDAKRQLHEALAQYFGDKPLWIDEDIKKAANLRKLSELPYQQTFGEMWDKLDSTLCDMQFVAAKCIELMLFDLLRDYSRAIEAKSLPGIEQIRHALSLEVPSLSARPALATQTIYNRLIWFDSLELQVRSNLAVARSQLDSQPYWISAEAPLPGAKNDTEMFTSFEIESSIQSLSPSRTIIGVASFDGDLDIRDLSNGEPVSRRKLNATKVIAIALDDDFNHIAHQNVKGEIRTEQSSAVLRGRSRERFLAYHPLRGILAVREDHALVSWDPYNNECTIIAEDLPFPLATLRLNPDKSKVFFTAGFNNQTMGISSWSNGRWLTKILPYAGPRIVDADVDPEAMYVVIASMDRRLQILETKTGKILAHLKYEARDEVILRGAPQKCAWGVGDARDLVFLATDKGNIARWNWRLNTVERLADWRAISEPANLIIFETITTSNSLFLSTESSGRIITGQSLQKPLARHSAAVTACFITASKKVVSASALDHTVRWFSAEGLGPLVQQSHRGPTVIAAREDTDDAIIGDQGGMIWNQTPNAKVNPEDIFMAFAEPVISLFDSGEGCAIASGKSGRTLRVHLFTDKVDVLWRSTGFQTQQKILPTNTKDLFWSLRRDQLAEGTYTVLSLVHDIDKEDVIISTPEVISDAAVCHDGTTICIAGQSVRIMRRLGWRWTKVYHRDLSVSHVAFLCEDDLIAVVLSKSPWLEVWSVAEGLPTVASIYLPSQVSCLSARRDGIVAGCLSGDLISLRVCGQYRQVGKSVKMGAK